MDYELTYHIATLDDADMLGRWDRAPHMQIARGQSDWWHWEEELCQTENWREMLIVKYCGNSFGFLQIMNAGQDPYNYWDGLDHTHMAIDMWIGEERFLNRGFGSLILRYAVKRAFQNPEITTVWIDPLAQNMQAIHFYQKHGFQPVEINCEDADRLYIHNLTRQNWEAFEKKTDGGAY